MSPREAVPLLAWLKVVNHASGICSLKYPAGLRQRSRMMDPALLFCRVPLAVAKTQGLRVLTASPSLAAWAALMPRQAPLLPAYMSPALETSAAVPSRTSRRIPSAMALAAAVPLMAHTGPPHMEVRAWHPYRLAIIHKGRRHLQASQVIVSRESCRNFCRIHQPHQWCCSACSVLLYVGFILHLHCKDRHLCIFFNMPYIPCPSQGTASADFIHAEPVHGTVQ